MASKSRINVVWFKCTDLRTHDHAALRAAHADGLPVLHLYVFDPFWHAGKTRLCGYPKTGILRSRFQLEALSDLSSRLQARGQVLCTRSGISTKQCFSQLCDDFQVNAVYAFHEICSEELRIQRQVQDVLRERGQSQLRLFWGFELYHRDDLPFDPARPRGAFNSYTAFRKRVEEAARVRATTQEAVTWTRRGNTTWARADSTMPSVADIMGKQYDAADDRGEGKDPRAEIRWQGGETAALARVQDFIWDTDSLALDYVGATMTTDPGKSCMRDKAMSKLSPWLAHGCLSPRLLYEEVKRYERERRKTKSTYWITHELLWRDFVRFASINAGNSMFFIGGPQNVHPTWQWSTKRDHLQAWVQGQTGYPFVDCFMRELATTGYCNHMGRECAGWFLIGDLGIDWRMGAEWFESILVDYEPTANWYNWSYRCLPAISRKAAPGERLHGLEVLKWGTQHDPDATYIKRWIPELASLPCTVAREPWRLGLNEPSDKKMGATGGSEVDEYALAAVCSMGFSSNVARGALLKVGGADVEAAVELLVAGLGADKNAMVDVSSDEDDELAAAKRLSMEAPGKDRSSEFRYGVDYPKPMIQPVSLMNTEESEEVARREQAKRDREVASTRERQAPSRSFNKQHWESAKMRRPAETPTAAGQPVIPAASQGYRSQERPQSQSHGSQGRPTSQGYDSQEQTSGDSRKRRWHNGRNRGDGH